MYLFHAINPTKIAIASENATRSHIYFGLEFGNFAAGFNKQLPLDHFRNVFLSLCSLQRGRRGGYWARDASAEEDFIKFRKYYYLFSDGVRNYY